MAWEQDLDVVLTVKNRDPFKGKIGGWSSSWMQLQGMDECIIYDDIIELAINKPDWIERNEHNAIYTKLAALSDRLDDLKAIEECKDDSNPEARDIAKEVWTHYITPIGAGRIAHDDEEKTLVRAESATREQMYLMTAAPELADKTRTLLNELEHVVAYYEDCEELINFLRDLGVPNVAPWYKEDTGSCNESS